MKLKYPAEAFALGIVLFSRGNEGSLCRRDSGNSVCGLCRIPEKYSGEIPPRMEPEDLRLHRSGRLMLICFPGWFCRPGNSFRHRHLAGSFPDRSSYRLSGPLWRN